MAAVDVGRIVRNPIDRLINYFAPERANARLQARLTREGFLTAFGSGGYDAARASNRGTQALKGRARDGSANSAITPDLPTLRKTSSDLIRNSGVAKGGIDQLTNKTIGQGLTLQARPDAFVLGLSDDAASAKAKELEQFWWHWHKRADATRRFNFGILERLGLYSTFEMGDCFALKVAVKNPGDLFAFKIQLVEAARISNPIGQTDNPNLCSGIVLDDLGCPTAVWIADRHPWDYSPGAKTAVTWKKFPIFGGDTGRRNVIHMMLPNRVGQTRGVPILAPVIEVLEQLTTYSRAELMATVMNSMFAIVAKTQDDSPLPTAGETTQNSPLRRVGFTAEAGMILEGLGEESIESFTPQRPNQNFAPFWDAMTDEIGAAIGVAGEVLRRQFKASYSASRAALLETYDSCRTHSTWYAATFNQECYEEVLFEAVTSGLIDLPGWQEPIIWDAWVNAEWVPPPRPSLDPLKEAQAARELIDGNLSTEAIQTTQVTGGDWETNQIQRRKERAAAPAPAAQPTGRAAPAKPADPAAAPADDTTDEETGKPT